MSLNLEQSGSGSFCLTKVGMAIGSTATQLSTAASATMVVDGAYIAAKGATATFALVAATGYNVTTTIPIGFKQAYGVWCNNAGTLTISTGPQSPITAATDKVGPPGYVSGSACIGVVTVAAVTAAFIPGTTAFNAAGVTTTYTDVISLPPGAIA